MIGDRTCKTCKFFFRQVQNPSECHFDPPRTTVLLLGLDPKGAPVLHHVVTRGITHEGMEACGRHLPRIERAH